MNCENCIHSHEMRQAHEIKKTLVCKRYPPTAHLVQQPGGVGIMTIFPPVDIDGVCGEHSDKYGDDINPWPIHDMHS